ncbi:MAG TPA: Maf family protein [Usitatibacter sp.]|nr:Maf family protein [Usitatibacter sp.]
MIFLASRSPRRRELLQQIGVRFEPLLFRAGARADPDTDETVHPGEEPDTYVRRIAEMKARAAWQRVTMRHGLQRKPVLVADTTVALGNDIFGKPIDRADAERMLGLLAGTRHRVLTAVAITFEGRMELAVSESHVTFGALTPERVTAYVQTGEPFDKAGAYAVQGRAATFIERIEGSYTGIMGLPLYETTGLLAKFGIAVP